MSLYKCVYAGRRKANRAKKNGNSFYHLFSRAKSDSIRVEVAELLGYDFRHTTPFDAFSSLGEPEYNSSDSDSLLKLISCRALFSKDADLLSPHDREKKAFESFLLSEESCKVVNDRIRNKTIAEKFSDLEPILFYAQGKISRILGECPTINELDLFFGPGASTSCKKITNARRKLSTKPSITMSSLRILSELRDELPYYQPSEADIMDATIDFVPKNLKTHRMICIEPTVSGMVQKGIGSVIKHKLLKNGVDLRDQTINQKRAVLGSRNGSYSTIDLERASDSVSTNLVMDLLPFDWYLLLDSVRSKQVRYKNVTYRLEKFSSMGNGYTFELESLIFHALAFGIARHYNLSFDFSVYGDDMVTTPELANKIIEIFPLLGFTPNLEKSYLSGPFRESCGADALLGIDVRPYYIRGRLSVASLVQWYNFLKKKMHFDPDGRIRDLLRSKIPPRFQIYGPPGMGDGHLIGGDNSCLKPYKRSHGWAGYTFETCIKIPNHDPTDSYDSDWKLPMYLASCMRQVNDFDDLDPLKDLGLSSVSDPTIRRSGKTDIPLGRKIRVYVLADPFVSLEI